MSCGLGGPNSNPFAPNPYITPPSILPEDARRLNPEPMMQMFSPQPIQPMPRQQDWWDVRLPKPFETAPLVPVIQSFEPIVPIIDFPEPIYPDLQADMYSPPWEIEVKRPYDWSEPMWTPPSLPNTIAKFGRFSDDF